VLLLLCLALIILIFFLSFFIKLDLQVEYLKDNENDHLRVGFKMLQGLIGYKVKIPVIDWRGYGLNPSIRMKSEWKASPGSEREEEIEAGILFPYLIGKIPPLHKIHFIALRLLRINGWILKHVKCKKFLWKTRLGFKDPAFTGISAGMLWIVKDYLYRKLRGNVKEMLDKPEIQVLPNFEEKRLQTQLNCIFTLTLGHIIIAGIRLVILEIISFFIMKGAKLL